MSNEEILASLREMRNEVNALIGDHPNMLLWDDGDWERGSDSANKDAVERLDLLIKKIEGND